MRLGSRASGARRAPLPPSTTPTWSASTRSREADGAPFLVMERVAGRTLAAVLAEEPVAIETVLDLGAQLADGLAAAHRAGVVHRDLKPANVMVWATRAAAADRSAIVLYNVAAAHALAGRADSALDYLEQALDPGFTHRVAAEKDPDFDSLADQPGFQRILERMDAAGR
ncbi:MAG TPA: protein kinase [Thermoanaerobaculia bacterium]|nr:protein kinase [Thermoanaerobaculia bacterium]